MAQEEEMSSLFPVFALSLVALIAIPWTIYRLASLLSRKTQNLECPCSLCQRCPKNRPSTLQRIRNFLSWSNIILIGLWITMAALLFYINTLNQTIKPFDPFSILGVQPGASDSDIKKAYRKLSLKYHPDKNPDPAAQEYFRDYIVKAHEALTDEVARKNYEEYGHPDGQQSMNVGIALPKFMLEIQGARGAYLLLGLVGVGILLPLIAVVLYLNKSAKYTGNNIMHSTLANYYHLMKPSLAPSKVMDVLTKATEFLELKLRSPEVDPLQQLFQSVRLELNLDPKNLKQETLKFWRRIPGLVKVELLLHAQLLREADHIPHELRKDYAYCMKLMPRLLEELMKMALFPRTSEGHGWLRPAMGVMELSQCIMQAVPLSARKASEKAAALGNTDGHAALLQLPHVDEVVIKKLGRKKIRTFHELRDLSPAEREEALTGVGGLSAAEAADVEAVLGMMPDVTVEPVMLTEGEEGIEEGDVVTLKVWLTMRRPNGLIEAHPHTPHYPFKKEEAFWLILADASSNTTWVSQRVQFSDEAAAIRAAADYERESAEGEGSDDATTNKRVKDAMDRVKGGSRLVVAKFPAPAEAVYALTVMLMSDVWIGCDKRIPMKLKVNKRTRAGTRPVISEMKTDREDGEGEQDEEGSEEAEGGDLDDEDYLSEYSEEEEEEDQVNGDQAESSNQDKEDKKTK